MGNDFTQKNRMARGMRQTLFGYAFFICFKFLASFSLPRTNNKRIDYDFLALVFN
jgi:hypothetical protein